MRFQTAPLAFLGALDIKADGINPSAFADEVRGSFNLNAFYLLPEIRQFSENKAAGTVTDGTVTVLTVPAKEAWYLYGAAATIGVAAGDTITAGFQHYVGVQQLDGTNVPLAVSVARDALVVPAGGVGLRVACVLPQPILLPPGYAVICRSNGNITAAGNTVFLAAALIHACPV